MTKLKHIVIIQYFNITEEQRKNNNTKPMGKSIDIPHIGFIEFLPSIIPLVQLYHIPNELATRSPIGSLKARTHSSYLVYRIGTKPLLRGSYQLVQNSFYEVSNPRNPNRHNPPIFQGASVIPVYHYRGTFDCFKYLSHPIQQPLSTELSLLALPLTLIYLSV